MRIFDRYIGKQVLFGTLYAVAVLGLVLVLGNLFQKIQPLLVEQKAPMALVLRFVLNVLPLSLMYTVPWGFLSAVLLIFGRLSQHQEITAFRVAGVSLVRLAVPVFVIGALFSLLSLWLNLNIVPKSKATVVQLLYEQASRDPSSLLKPGVAQGDLKGDGESMQKILIEEKSGDWVKGFHFYQIPTKPGGNRSYVHARRAALTVDKPNNQLRMKLEDAYIETHQNGKSPEYLFAGDAAPLLIDLKNPKTKKVKANAMSNEEIRVELANNRELSKDKKVQYRAEITKRYSFSMACLAFAFIAVPLGLGSRRRESSMGLLVSLLIGTGYFLLTMLANQFKTDAQVTAMLWAPNVLCVLFGLILFRRARFK